MFTAMLHNDQPARESIFQLTDFCLGRPVDWKDYHFQFCLWNSDCAIISKISSSFRHITISNFFFCGQFLAAFLLPSVQSAAFYLVRTFTVKTDDFFLSEGILIPGDRLKKLIIETYFDAQLLLSSPLSVPILMGKPQSTTCH